MGSVSELLLPYSIEGFLTDDEVDRILTIVDEYKAAHADTLAAGARGSVHASDVLSVEELVERYQPAGRLDINTADLPEEVIEIVEHGFFRHIEDIRRAYPAATWPFSYTYVEYGPSQFITPHADRTFAGFGVTLTNDFTGGEFCIETCGSNRLWFAGDTPQIAPGPHVGSDWFRQIPRTRWMTSPRKGVAIFYGGALVHSSQPVITGAAKRIFAFIAN